MVASVGIVSLNQGNNESMDTPSLMHRPVLEPSYLLVDLSSTRLGAQSPLTRSRSHGSRSPKAVQCVLSHSTSHRIAAAPWRASSIQPCIHTAVFMYCKVLMYSSGGHNSQINGGTRLWPVARYCHAHADYEAAGPSVGYLFLSRSSRTTSEISMIR
jgi:hypothetical protein